ncbi:hypothetical protein QJS04_geneDACA003365 [Acorus gramineus]|uniref:Divinyl chlorophyllide a 8-vinyl-reductase, chloroplastic n=1 Tax=Acorus gramineus TaxID=55184 RepID=A0AAV9BLJ8_ACOGR|nr:hypothetical protein QJS04_geneDACA003365 [Acorus gramineus]
MALSLSPPSTTFYFPTTLRHLHPPFHLFLSPPPLRHPRSISTVRSSSTTTTNPSPTTSPSPLPSFRDRDPHSLNILVVGSTGYIGKFVVRELVRRGFNVISVARDRNRDQTLSSLRGSTVCFSDVTDPSALDASLSRLGVTSLDAVVSCLASRGGGIKESWTVDYSATRNSLAAARARGASHFVLLSAICVQKPQLEFQRAKLKFEAELETEAMADPAFTYSIVRPTAFFKSLGGQVEIVKDGKPYVMFGDGRLCACKPISERDLASFIANCVMDSDKVNRILPIGGPGKALTPLEQGEMLFRLLGKEPKFLKVPIEVMDFVIGGLGLLSKVFPVMEDAVEFGRIGRYYAAESMLVWDAEKGEYSEEKTPSYGSDTLEEFFERVIREGMAGQELGEQTIF